MGRWVAMLRRWVAKLGRWVAKLGRWVAKLVARLLVTAAPWAQCRHLSKTQSGQRSGQHTLARQKDKQTNKIYRNRVHRTINEGSDYGYCMSRTHHRRFRTVPTLSTVQTDRAQLGNYQILVLVLRYGSVRKLFRRTM